MHSATQAVYTSRDYTYTESRHKVSRGYKEAAFTDPRAFLDSALKFKRQSFGAFHFFRNLYHMFSLNVTSDRMSLQFYSYARRDGA